MVNSKETFAEWKKQEPQATQGFDALMVWEYKQQQNDELQARIDKSTLILEDILKKGLIRSKYSLFDLEQALKAKEK